MITKPIKTGPVSSIKRPVTMPGLSLRHLRPPFEQYDSFSFSRNSASRDGLGVPVAANEPRYDKLRAYIVENYVGQNATRWASASATIVHSCGLNSAGQSAMHVWEASSGTLHAFENGSFTPHTSTNYSGFSNDLLKGVHSGERYKLSSMHTNQGVLIVVARRQDTSNNDQGIALLYSNDDGASFTAVEDGSGNRTFPTMNAGDDRGTIFCLHNAFFVSELEFWIVWPDYQLNPATGGQCGLARFWRTTTADPWQTDGARLVYTDSTASTHFHTAGLIMDDDGQINVILSVGDSTARNRVALIVVTDPSDYMNCTLETNETFYGGNATEFPDGGARANQFTAVAPLPDGNLVLGSDFDDQVITKMEIGGGPATADKYGICTPLWGQRSSENFCIVKHPTRNLYVSGDRRDSVAENDLMVSSDGEHWVECLRRSGGGVPQAQFYGDMIVHVVGGTGIQGFPMPLVDTNRGLQIGRGTKTLNRAGGTDDWSVWTAGSSGTVTKVTPNGSGLYLYPAGHDQAGEVLPFQPRSMLPVYILENDGLAGSSEMGRWYLTTDTTLASGNGAAIIEVYGLDAQGAELRFTFNDANAPIDVQSAANQGWVAHRVSGNIKAGTARPSARIYSRAVATNVHKPMQVFVTVSELVIEETWEPLEYRGIPTAALGTSPDELGVTDGEIDADAGDWSVKFHVSVNDYATTTNAADAMICSIVGEGGTYLNIFRDGDGVGDTIQADLWDGTTLHQETGTYPQATRIDGQFNVEVEQSGSDTIVRVTGVDELELTISGGTLQGELDYQLAANNDQSVIGLFTFHQIDQIQTV